MGKTIHRSLPQDEKVPRDALLKLQPRPRALQRQPSASSPSHQLPEGKNMLIVGISGKAKSGKDTAADFLVKNSAFVKIAFADPIKRMAAIAYPKMTREHLWGPSEMRNIPIKDYPRSHGPWMKTGDAEYRCACCNILSPDVPFRPVEDVQCFLTTRFALQQ